MGSGPLRGQATSRRIRSRFRVSAGTGRLRRREQAWTKADRLLAFFAAAMDARDNGPELPETAYDRWIEEKQRRIKVIRAYCDANGLKFGSYDWSDDHVEIAGQRMSVIEVRAKYLPDLYPALTQP